jgi:small subunit ribosomal protein S7
MSRRRAQKKKVWFYVDQAYQSYLINIFINRLIKHGKKFISYKILYFVLHKIQCKTKRNALVLLEHSTRKVIPSVHLKSRRIGGSVYQVPVEVNAHQGTVIAIQWILKSARSRQGVSIVDCLSSEIIDIVQGKGRSIRKREEVHRIAEANKAFARFRFLTQ